MKIKVESVFGTVLILALSAAVVVLSMQIKELRTDLEEALERKGLKVGDKVASAQFTNLKGGITTLDYHNTGKPTVLFVFSTTCKYCKKNSSIWNEIYSKSNGEKYQVYGISINDSLQTAQYAEQMGLQYPILLPSDSLFNKKYKISFVPQTIIVDAGGTVLNNWDGEISAMIKNEVIYYFNN